MKGSLLLSQCARCLPSENVGIGVRYAIFFLTSGFICVCQKHPGNEMVKHCNLMYKILICEVFIHATHGYISVGQVFVIAGKMPICFCMQVK